jgi:hypothetical protein
MGTKRDEEYFVLKMVGIIKDQLNTKIEEINSKESDSVVLDTVNSKAYYYRSFGQKTPEYDPIVIFSVGSEPTGISGGTSSEDITLGIQMVVATKMEAISENLYKRIVRYRRALKEVTGENYSFLHAYELSTLADIPFAIGVESFIGLGIAIKFNFAN